MLNLKLALRTLIKTPFVTSVAVLSLALGIGANAAIFSLFDQLLLRPMPVPAADRLVNLSAPGPKPGSQSCSQAGSCEDVFSYPMFRDLQKQQRVFTNIAAHRSFGANLAYKGQTLSAEGMLVSGSYFQVLQVQPALGRLFDSSDDRLVGEAPVVVLSHGYWTSKFGADPGVLNQPIIVNGQTLTVVGVAPRGFDGTTLGTKPSVFVPITLRGTMNPGFKQWANRQTYWAYLFARLRPGVTIDSARAALNAQYHAIINDVEAPRIKGMGAQTAARFRAQIITLTDGRKGQSSAITATRRPLTLLFAVTGIVLLIACANIANLLLARAANRTTEMAVRLSLGATRRQIITQVLTESVLLAVLGGIVSLGLAYWTLGGITALLSTEAARAYDFHLSTPVFVFTAIVSLATGVLFGLAPALSSTRPDLVTALRNNSGKLAGDRGAARFRASLVTVQIALTRPDGVEESYSVSLDSTGGADYAFSVTGSSTVTGTYVAAITNPQTGATAHATVQVDPG